MGKGSDLKGNVTQRISSGKEYVKEGQQGEQAGWIEYRFGQEMTW